MIKEVKNVLHKNIFVKLKVIKINSFIFLLLASDTMILFIQLKMTNNITLNKSEKITYNTSTFQSIGLKYICGNFEHI